MTTYTEIHRQSYLKHQVKNQTRMRAYYIANKETVKRKRRERYARERAAAAAESAAPAARESASVEA
jgi:hypothetical protein